MKKKISLRWLTNACYEIKCSGTRILTDPCYENTGTRPFSVNEINEMDIITLTHLHWDHVSNLPSVLKKYSPSICTGSLGAKSLLEWINYNASRVFPIDSDQEIYFPGVTLKRLYGRHANVNMTYQESVEKCCGHSFIKDYPGIETIQGIGTVEMCNYLYTFDNGITVLFWGGDITANQTHMLTGLNPDIAIMQYSCQDPKDLAELAKAINPKFFIPHHHDLRGGWDYYHPKMEKFLSFYDGKFIEPKNGEQFTLEF